MANGSGNGNGSGGNAYPTTWYGFLAYTARQWGIIACIAIVLIWFGMRVFDRLWEAYDRSVGERHADCIEALSQVAEARGEIAASNRLVADAINQNTAQSKESTAANKELKSAIHLLNTTLQQGQNQ